MVYKVRKKNRRQRAKTTHGWGSMKKHRGKGNKGGSGNAGTGKRGDAKKPTIWKEKYFGKFGFKKKGMKKKINALNLDDLEQNIQLWLEKKKITQEGESFKIDLNNLGYNKLLGRGLVKRKTEVIVDSATAIAKTKIEKAKGKVVFKE